MADLYTPTRAEDAARLAADDGAELLAGGTDVVDRLKTGALAPARLVRLRRVPGLTGILDEGTSLRVGARETLLDMAEHPRVRAAARVLAEAAEHTATPQIRALATVGGALCQRPRCVYLRHPDYACRKQGGATCFALHGDNASHAIFDNELCAAVHPSTIGAALLALDASLDVLLPTGERRSLSVADFFAIDPGAAAQISVENTLPRGALIEAVHVPLRQGRSLQRYERASPRLLADWAEVEVAVVLHLAGDVVADARVVLGAVGRVPRRARASERVLVGHHLDLARIDEAAGLAAEGARPLSQNGYRLELCRGAVRAALTEAVA